MIIEQCERMDLASFDFDGSFEITLPELMGLGSFEALRLGRHDFGSADSLMSDEDVVDGSDGGPGESWVLLFEEGLDFRSAPVEAIADLEDPLLQIVRGSVGTGVWCARSIDEWCPGNQSEPAIYRRFYG